MRKLGPYSRPSSLVDMDQRSREARIMAGVRADLTKHVGGSPSAPMQMLIERACWLTIHVAQLDAKAVAGGTISEHDQRTYLAWSNSLVRTLTALGLTGAPQRAPTPAEAMARHSHTQAAA